MCRNAIALACVSYTPDGATRVIGHQQRSILGNRKRGRMSPDFRARVTFSAAAAVTAKEPATAKAFLDFVTEHGDFARI